MRLSGKQSLIYKKGSRKPEQLGLIEIKLEFETGSQDKFIICAEKKFFDKFEEVSVE